MIHEFTNFLIFLFAIAKVSLLCGLLPGIAIAVIAERYGYQVVAFGVEESSGDGQLAQIPTQSLQWATSPSRKVRCA